MNTLYLSRLLKFLILSHFIHEVDSCDGNNFTETTQVYLRTLKSELLNIGKVSLAHCNLQLNNLQIMKRTQQDKMVKCLAMRTTACIATIALVEDHFSKQ